MKNRIVLLISLVAVLVLATVVVVQAGSPNKITGSMKAVYEETGFNWHQINVHMSPSGEVTGFLKYRSYTENPNDWGGWRAEPVCVSFGEYNGMPAATVVVQFTEATEITWVGQYAKGLYMDGGQNATNDLVGLVVWPPVDVQPICAFEAPFWAWPGVGGNITIH